MYSTFPFLFVVHTFSRLSWHREKFLISRLALHFRILLRLHLPFHHNSTRVCWKINFTILHVGFHCQRTSVVEAKGGMEELGQDDSWGMDWSGKPQRWVPHSALLTYLGPRVPHRLPHPSLSLFLGRPTFSILFTTKIFNHNSSLESCAHISSSCFHHKSPK